MRSEDLEKYDYSPVMGEPENGFYPVPKGRGTYYWNGERIVPKERGWPGENELPWELYEGFIKENRLHVPVEEILRTTREGIA